MLSISFCFLFFFVLSDWLLMSSFCVLFLCSSASLTVKNFMLLCVFNSDILMIYVCLLCCTPMSSP